MNGDSRTMDRPLTGPERRRRRSPSCTCGYAATIQEQNRRLACWNIGPAAGSGRGGIVTATLVAAMAAIVIAGVGWYDAERRCRQWQRQAERHQRRAEEADAWSDQFERDADSYQEAHSILAERYAALYAAHTHADPGAAGGQLHRDRQQRGEEAHGQLSVESTAAGVRPSRSKYGCADSHRSIVSARCPPRNGLISFFEETHERGTYYPGETGRSRRRCGRPDAQLRRHSQCAERRHGHQRAQRRLARDQATADLCRRRLLVRAPVVRWRRQLDLRFAWRPRMCRR